MWAATLWRLHGASTLLVVPQIAISTFSLEYLVSQRHWDASTAGVLLFGFQIAGAAGRLAAGKCADRAGIGAASYGVGFAVVAALASLGHRPPSANGGAQLHP